MPTTIPRPSTGRSGYEYPDTGILDSRLKAGGKATKFLAQFELSDENIASSRKAGNQLPSDAASHARRTDTFTLP